MDIYIQFIRLCYFTYHVHSSSYDFFLSVTAGCGALRGWRSLRRLAAHARLWLDASGREGGDLGLSCELSSWGFRECQVKAAYCHSAWKRYMEDIYI